MGVGVALQAGGKPASYWCNVGFSDVKTSESCSSEGFNLDFNIRPQRGEGLCESF